MKVAAIHDATLYSADSPNAPILIPASLTPRSVDAKLLKFAVKVGALQASPLRDFGHGARLFL